MRCGVSTSAIGFAEPQDDGSYKGFDADYCRAVAAAVLGDANKVEYVGTTAAERFALLASGEVDVLFRNTTWTQSRDTELGGDFGPTTFYDGQQIMGKSEFGFNEGSTLAHVDGAKLCTNAGTTTEKNITEGARVVGAEIDLITVENFPEAMDLFRQGSCDLVTTDGSALFGQRYSAIQNGEIAEGEWIIFPTTPISKEPLGPMYRQNDSTWADVINWTVYALVIADEKGITSANIDEMVANPPDPEAGRLLGVGRGRVADQDGHPGRRVRAGHPPGRQLPRDLRQQPASARLRPCGFIQRGVDRRRPDLRTSRPLTGFQTHYQLTRRGGAAKAPPRRILA